MFRLSPITMILPLLGAVACAGSTTDATGAREPGFSDWLGRTFSAQARSLERRREALLQEIETLPQPAGSNTSMRLGWHTPGLPSPGTTVWVQVDLGAVHAVDRIALVAASGEIDGRPAAGYGFPLRLRIEVSDDSAFASRMIVADFTAVDVPNPGAMPLVVRGAGRRARFVRVTATQVWPRRDDWIVALGEIIVLAGNRNVAAGRPVHASHSAASRPMWDAVNLTDEQSVLGPPVGPGPSPSNGYLAVQEPKPAVVKWVQVDLGREFALDEVRLFPARPTDFADTPGSGFPVRFRIEAAAQATMEAARVLFDSGERPFPNPGENLLTVPAAGVRAQHVRVTATHLHDRGTVASFALAELEVWAEGRNVARNAPVSALDRYDKPAFPRWRPEYLVDGYNSRHPILDLPRWLDGLSRRSEIESELVAINAARVAAVDATLALVVKSSVAAMMFVAVGAGIFVWRTRAARRDAVEDLRRRIAGDLHDEIGSHLGSIGLLSEAARRATDPGHAREDLAEIGRIAGRTNEALREIVWLLDPKPITRAELVTRMRETAPGLLAGMVCRFESPPVFHPAPCPLEFARNVWMIFKETLHNAAKHSGAQNVCIRIAESEDSFTLTVADDGRGFREEEIEPGRGLHSLRQRAAQLRAVLELETVPGRGTTVRLTVPHA